MHNHIRYEEKNKKVGGDGQGEKKGRKRGGIM